jgi:SRSO17 transposase
MSFAESIAFSRIVPKTRLGLSKQLDAHAGYGGNMVGIFSHTTVWTSDRRPLPPKKWSDHGRPSKLLRRDRKHQPISVKELALKLPKRAWRTIKWREGSADMRCYRRDFLECGFVPPIVMTISRR